jgi:hypothetical protein
VVNLLQQGSVILCEKQNFTVAEVQCVGVSGEHHGSTHAAGGFAILTPLPPVMWSADAFFKVSLRRISLASAEELTVALKKETSKLPSRMELLRKDVIPKVVKLDAGRKLPEYTLEVISFPCASAFAILLHVISLHGYS